MKTISIFIIALCLLGFLSLVFPDKASAQDPATFGSCCSLSIDVCATCDFPGCAYSRDYCEEELGGDFESGAGGVCVDEPDRGPRCGDGDLELDGCCVVEEGNCQDGVIRGNCFDDQGEGADFWAFNESCSNIPQCEPKQRSVPTFNHWGLIATAGILGIVGFIVIRRKLASA